MQVGTHFIPSAWNHGASHVPRTKTLPFSRWSVSQTILFLLEKSWLPLSKRYRKTFSSLRTSQFSSVHPSYWNCFPLQVSNILYMHKGIEIGANWLKANQGFLHVLGSCRAVQNVSSVPNIPSVCRAQGNYRTNHKDRAAIGLLCPPCTLFVQSIIWPLLSLWPVEISQWKTQHQRRRPYVMISLEKDSCILFKEAFYFLVRTGYHTV